MGEFQKLILNLFDPYGYPNDLKHLQGRIIKLREVVSTRKERGELSIRKFNYRDDFFSRRAELKI